MFFYKTFKRQRRVNQIKNVFSQSFEMKENFKVGKNNVKLMIMKYRIAIEFGDYDKTSKRTLELEKNGIRVFNIPESENIINAIGRLLYVIQNSPLYQK